MDWPITEWIEAVRGWLVSGSLETHIGGISTDSRTISPGQMFVALKGPKFDGHDFCRDAVAKGAVALMVSRLEEVRDQTTGDTEGAGSAGNPVAIVAVEDTLAALGKLAEAWRARFSPLVAALSGSSGKTTAKEMLRAMVEPLGGLVTQGNLNNRIGVPLTVFRLEDNHKLAVFELAMNQPGELGVLTEIVCPEIVALTNVGTAHLGNFASRDDLRTAKAELIVHSPQEACVVLNADCYSCSWVAERFCAGRDVARFGMVEPAHFRAERIEPAPPLGYRFNLVIPDGQASVTLKAFGRHNISNALCAAAVAYIMGIDLEPICAALEAFRSTAMRGEILGIGRVTIIADCYNANPDSVEAALDGLVEFAGPRRRLFVFADMLELGEEAQMEHRLVGQAVAERSIALFATTGEMAQWASWEAGRMFVRAGHFDSKEQLVEALMEEIRPGDVILVKGSRLMALEEVVERLKEKL